MHTNTSETIKICKQSKQWLKFQKTVNVQTTMTITITIHHSVNFKNNITFAELFI
jgi:hypothetical protein